VLCDPANRAQRLAAMLHDKEFGIFAMALRWPST